MSLNTQNLLQLEALEVSYPPTAVRGVDLELAEGEILGLVGASGCGKSSLAKAVLGLAPIQKGRVMLRGSVMAASGFKPQKEQRRRVQLMFQDPSSALSPRRTVRQALEEPLGLLLKSEREQFPRMIADALDSVGLDQALADRFPNQLSGGQRQRVALARAIITSPELVIADEPVSALDVTVQAQILELIKSLNTRRGLTFLLISHDLAVVRQIADRVAVMRRGVIVECGKADQVLGAPEHDYTRALLAAVPVPDPDHPRPVARQLD